MKFNLKNFPEPDVTDEYPRQKLKDIFRWKEGFEAELREIDFSKWYDENHDEMMQKFKLHSHSGFSPENVLIHFVEKEILGE